MSAKGSTLKRVRQSRKANDYNNHYKSMMKTSIKKALDSSSKKDGESLKDEAFKILGLKPGSSKEQIIKAANTLQKKIHPDVNPNSNTERLSQIVNEAKDTILNNDFS